MLQTDSSATQLDSYGAPVRTPFGNGYGAGYSGNDGYAYSGSNGYAASEIRESDRPGGYAAEGAYPAGGARPAWNPSEQGATYGRQIEHNQRIPHAEI